MATKTQLQEALARAEAEIARLRAEDSPTLQDPNGAAAAIRAAIPPFAEQEHFVVLLLNTRQRILSARVIGVGTINKVEVHPREIFRDAVRMSAHAIILGHNHPSEDPTPSDADTDLTRRMVAAGKLIGIPVLDHVIVTTTAHVSLAGIGLV